MLKLKNNLYLTENQTFQRQFDLRSILWKVWGGYCIGSGLAPFYWQISFLPAEMMIQSSQPYLILNLWPFVSLIKAGKRRTFPHFRTSLKPNLQHHYSIKKDEKAYFRPDLLGFYAICHAECKTELLLKSLNDIFISFIILMHFLRFSLKYLQVIEIHDLHQSYFTQGSESATCFDFVFALRP